MLSSTSLKGDVKEAYELSQKLENYFHNGVNHELDYAFLDYNSKSINSKLKKNIAYLNAEVIHKFNSGTERYFEGVRLKFDKDGKLKSKYHKRKNNQGVDTIYYFVRKNSKLDTIVMWDDVHEFQTIYSRYNEDIYPSKSKIKYLKSTNFYESIKDDTIIKEEFDVENNWIVRIIKRSKMQDTIVLERAIMYY